MKKILPLVLFITVFSKIQGQTLTPGTSYYNANNYAEYIYGTLPIIISAPHGGTTEPASMPDRTTACGSDIVTVTDLNTQELARAINSAFFRILGAYPHTVICRLGRSKLDMNRARSEAACGNATGEQTWEDYHTFIDSARQRILRQYGRGLFIDLHGHGHTKQRNEIGYLASADDLRSGKTLLDANAAIEESSIRYLAQNNTNNLSHGDLLFGDNAFGTLLASAGYPSVPSRQDSFPVTGDPYFNGGYNTQRYGSRNGGTLESFQIETNYTGVRDNAANRRAFAEALVNAIKTYIDNNFSPLPAAAPLAGSPFGNGNLLIGRYNTTGTTAQKITLGELDPVSKTLVQNIDLPSTGLNAITLRTLSTEGLFSTTSDKRYVVIPAYFLNEGSVTSTTNGDVNRVIGRLDASRNFTTYKLPNSSASSEPVDPYQATNMRSVYSPDGSRFYTAGTSSGTSAGVWTLAAGEEKKAAQLSSARASRWVTQAGGQLFMASQGVTGGYTQGVFKLGNGMPTSAADTVRLFTPGSSVLSIALTDDGAICYVCNNSSAPATTPQIEKWTLANNVWTKQYNIVAFSGSAPIGMAARFSATNAKLYVLFNTRVVEITDNLSSTINSATSATVYTETGTNTNLRGISFVPEAPATLPVKLTAFTGKVLPDAVQLSWQVSLEENVKEYLVESSPDGKNFTVEGKVTAAGSSVYSYTDNRPATGKVYYRLTIMDHDGKYSYSRVISFDRSATALSLSPNPVIQTAVITHPAAAGNARLTIVSADGRAVLEKRVEKGSRQTVLSVAHLLPGIYMISYYNNGEAVKYKMIKQ